MTSATGRCPRFEAKGHVIDANLTPPLVPGDIRSSHPLYALLP